MTKNKIKHKLIETIESLTVSERMLIVQVLLSIAESCMLQRSAVWVIVNINTELKWRHRILVCLSDGRAKQLNSISESDETCFLLYFKDCVYVQYRQRKPRWRGKAKQLGLSKKQDRMLVARHRGGDTADFNADYGNINNEKLKQYLLPMSFLSAIRLWHTRSSHAPTKLSLPASRRVLASDSTC